MHHQHGQRPDPTHAMAPLAVAIALAGAALAVAACGAAPTPPATAAGVSGSLAAAGPTGTPPPTEPASTPAPSGTPAPTPGSRNPAAVDGSRPYRPSIDPADFTTTIDNPFMPLVPGTRFVFSSSNGEHIEVNVTADTRAVMGVDTVVVHDIAKVGGKVIEDTFDWYAQDRAGNVWYFGEDTKSFEEGPAGDPAGSWEAGVGGAQPGVVMLADPLGGDVYRQEFLAGEAEDLALVRQLDGAIKVRAGAFGPVLVTEEWSPFEPKVIEHKSYAKGIGVVAERQVVGGDEKVDLVEVHQPGA